MTATDDTKAIEAVIKSYFDGLYEGDVEKLAVAFHPTSALTSVGADGKIAIVPRAQWFDGVAKRPSAKSQGQARGDHILMIDQPGPTMAYVKVRCQLPPRYFVDQLSLLKVDGRWQIVQKIFQAETR